ncbi:MAG: hypothetical protein LQ339_008609 [Xanthoria mediterranea]|nr:MAG: hypothetical protein LQ339_008609 [Xanthoria mediterranea]
MRQYHAMLSQFAHIRGYCEQPTETPASLQDKGEDDVWVWADDNIAAESVDPAPAVLLGLHRQMGSIAKKYGIDTLERVAQSRLRCLSEVIAKHALWSRVPFAGLVRMVPKLQGVTFEGSRTTYSYLVDTFVKRTVDDPSLLTDEDTSYKHQPNPSTQLTVTMKYSVSAVAFASLAAHAAAQGCNVKVDPNKQSGNPVRAPLTEIVPAGTPYTITWDATTPTKPIAIELLRGPAENILPIQCLTSNSPNTGKFVWTPSTDLTADVTHYGLRIIVADGSGQFQYSNQFGISNDVINQPTSSSVPTTKTESSSTRPTSDASTLSSVDTSSIITSSIYANTTTATVPIVTVSSNSSSIVVIATTHVPVPSSGALPTLTVLQPTNNMTVPASLQTSKTQTPSGVTASSTSVQTGTGSPIAGPGTVPSDSGAGRLLAGSMLAVLAAMGAFLL